jgi:hypothetical protein
MIHILDLGFPHQGDLLNFFDRPLALVFLVLILAFAIFKAAVWRRLKEKPA